MSKKIYKIVDLYPKKFSIFVNENDGHESLNASKRFIYSDNYKTASTSLGIFFHLHNEDCHLNNYGQLKIITRRIVF